MCEREDAWPGELAQLSSAEIFLKVIMLRVEPMGSKLFLSS